MRTIRKKPKIIPITSCGDINGIQENNPHTPCATLTIHCQAPTIMAEPNFHASQAIHPPIARTASPPNPLEEESEEEYLSLYEDSSVQEVL